MSKKGIIYICTTSVEGLIKIGRTDNFNSRMAILEQNGYWNVSGLKRFYAARVDDYIEKEKLIHTIFSKSQVSNSELFALDKNLAKEMLDAFEGEVIYPEQPKKIEPVKVEINQANDIVTKRPRRPNFSFEMLNIPVGSILTYINDSNITCKTIDNNNKVEFRNEVMTLTGVAKILLNLKPGDTVSGPTCFYYKDKLVSQIYDELIINKEGN